MYLLPKPSKLKSGKGKFYLTMEKTLSLCPGASELVVRQTLLFAKKAEEELGYPLTLARGTARPGDLVFRQDDTMGPEAYTLKITPDTAELVGSARGLWQGMQTLLQILYQEGGCLPALLIEDEPALPNRGFYFDCARGRVPRLSWLKSLADRMAGYKLNQLQLYIEHSYLFRGMTELWRDDTPLTAADIMELDTYCAERGIELVPSLSSFGHLYKLLSTKSYSHLCELEDSADKPFSVKGRMDHHTINPTNPESLKLILGMIAEYMELFSSRKFNFCADETFDLGTGRSRAAADAQGKDRLYIDFVKAIAQFLTDRGRQPMFWGDIVLGFPSLIRELPKGVTCLNWGYSPDQEEEPTRKLHEAGAAQYCCPGCIGWNRLVPGQKESWQNITRQCSYAAKYRAEGLLNTDWGDYYHINHPDLSRIGMIYGAAFSWNADILPYEEINRQISRLEYGDRSEKLLAILDRLKDMAVFDWQTVCHFQEVKRGLLEEEWFRCQTLPVWKERLPLTDKKSQELQEICQALYSHLQEADPRKRDALVPYLTAAEGILLWNQVGKAVASREYHIFFDSLPHDPALAAALETWFYRYKEQYRRVSRQSELGRTEALICWYGDYLRDGAPECRAVQNKCNEQKGESHEAADTVFSD